MPVRTIAVYTSALLLLAACASAQRNSHSPPEQDPGWNLGHTRDIRNLDDHRLARGVMTGFNMYPKHITRVGEIVSKILYAFAGEDIKEQVNYNELELADRASAEKWWVKANAMGEEQYLLTHVMPSENTPHGWPNMHNAMLIAQRYPNRLRGLYEKLQREYPEVHTGVFAELMAKSMTQP